MSDIFNKPSDLLKAYREGFMGSWCDPKDTDKLLGELPHPLFGAAAYNLYGSGKGKLSLPFKNLLTFDPNFGPSEKQVQGDCFHEDSIVISKYCKAIKDVEIGDKVYDSNGKITTVISKQVKLSHNQLVTIHTLGSVPLSVTSDHKVLIGRKETGDSGNVATKTLVKHWVAAQDVRVGDYVITPTSLEICESVPDNKFTAAHDFGWFLGYFLGDGWCNATNLEITFAEHQEKLYERCFSFLKIVGLNPRKEYYSGKTKTTTAFRLRCSSRELSTFLRSVCYDNSKNKVFPNWAIGNLDVISGLIDSDGFTTSNAEGYMFNSSSKSLAYGVYYSYLANGFLPTINKFHRSKKGAYANGKQSYRVTNILHKKKNYSIKQDNQLFIRVRKIEIKEGPHTVYDIGVACKEHAFLANGCVAHNCVSHSTRNAVDVTRSCEIVNGDREEFIARGAVEAIYGSRGHGGEGMSCSVAARFVNKVGGLLIRKAYGDIDLSTYSGIGGKWGRTGIPQELINEAKKNPVKTISLISTIEQARDAIANGYGISVCSMSGFSSRRDKHGIASRSGSWAHAMAWVGMDDTHEIYKETLFLVQNSWGIWNNGPKRHDQPDGSFWIREKDAAEMLSGNGSWVFSDVDGFPPRKVNWTINTVF
jgi:hypothetical protein